MRSDGVLDLLNDGNDFPITWDQLDALIASIATDPIAEEGVLELVKNFKRQTGIEETHTTQFSQGVLPDEQFQP